MVNWITHTTSFSEKLGGFCGVKGGKKINFCKTHRTKSCPSHRESILHVQFQDDLTNNFFFEIMIETFWFIFCEINRKSIRSYSIYIFQTYSLTLVFIKDWKCWRKFCVKSLFSLDLATLDRLQLHVNW